MSLLQKFDSDSYGSLTIHKDDEGREYFRAIDVCYALKHSNPSQALSRLVEPEYVVQIDDGTNRSGKVNYLSEPGLYQLIFASKSVGAKAFQRWVFEEVLPKLRASGGYISPTATGDQLIGLQSQIGKLQSQLQKLEKEKQSILTGAHSLDRFIEKCLIFDRSDVEGAGEHCWKVEVYAVYEHWCKSEKKRPVRFDEFIRTLIQRFGQEHDQDNWLAGLSIKPKYKAIGYAAPSRK